MNNRFCTVCGEEYNATLTGHTCTPDALEIIFLQEREFGEGASLNGDMLARIKTEIEDNGNPPALVEMWEKSAGRPFGGVNG